MKRLFFILVFVVAISAIGYGQSAIVISQNANVRGTASGTGKIVATLAIDTTVDVIRQIGPWFLVQSADYVGWMHGDTLKITNADSSRYTTWKYSPPVVEMPVVRSTSTVPANTPTQESQTLSLPGAIIVPSSSAPATVVNEPKQGVASSEPTEPATGRCKDGTLTYSDSRQGACSDHGGLDTWYADTTTTRNSTSMPSSSGGTVQVKGYYRKDGTYVSPHTRSAPRRRP